MYDHFLILARCGKLKRLILNNNQLVTIPDAHYFLTDLEVSMNHFKYKNNSYLLFIYVHCYVYYRVDMIY